MLYAWVKMAVGALLAANFSVPLVTVVSNRHLWEEPMAVLVGNKSLICTVLGIVMTLIGIYDVAHLQNVALCRFLQYSGFGVGIAFKMAQVGVAVDQFVAVVYPLHHYPIMMRALPWLFTATWLTWAAQIIFGLFAHTFDLETFSDVSSQGNNTTTAFTGCRWETGLADVYTIIVELEMVTFSLVTASLLVYTGAVGYRYKVRLMCEERQLRQNGSSGGGDNQTFFDNYRAFKFIIAVLSLTVSLDIVAPVLRISSRWYPRPNMNGLLHQARLFCFIFEGWAYGLLNNKLRAAYKRTLCGRFNRVVDFEMVQKPQRRQRASEEPALQQLPTYTLSRAADG